MRHKSSRRAIRHFLIVALVWLAGPRAMWAQQQRELRATESLSPADAIEELQAQVRGLHSALADLRAATASYRAETLQLRRELEATRAQLASAGFATQPPASLTASSSGTDALEIASGATRFADRQREDPRLGKLEEEYQLLAAKVDEQYQTKVESASKYRVRLSGIVLLNVVNNVGAVDNLDFPTLAASPARLDSRGNFGASLRQSQIGLEVFGAQIGGAKASANVQFDLSGGFANTFNGVALGLVRLRTATLRLEWARTSVVAGQDALFFAPLSPTSLATLAVPAFSYAGNLWAWVPQVRVEHRLDLRGGSRFVFQGGILDALTGEPPATPFLRTPHPGERSRQPAYAGRVAWTRGPTDRPLTLGFGGYYSRQNWGFGREIDAWVGTADWNLPLGSRFNLTGQFYRGRAVGGLGGAFGRSILTRGPLSNPSTYLEGLNSLGGWAQLKFKPTTKLEFNGAFGQDNPLASDLRRFPANQSTLYPAVARNRSSLVNFIYQPRSDLLFSVEYRRLRTFELRGESRTADHINVSMGITF